MKVAVAIAACMGIITAPLMAKADSLYSACGPQAVGLIVVGGKKTCLLESETKAQKIPGSASTQRASSDPAVTAGSNKDVDDDLNVADGRFREGDREGACRRIQMAIETSHRTTDQPVSENQKAQLSNYSQRCNLRY